MPATLFPEIKGDCPSFGAKYLVIDKITNICKGGFLPCNLFLILLFILLIIFNFIRGLSVIGSIMVITVTVKLMDNPWILGIGLSHRRGGCCPLVGVLVPLPGDMDTAGVAWLLGWIGGRLGVATVVQWVLPNDLTWR